MSRRSPWLLVGGAAIAALVVGGGVVVAVNRTEERRRVREALRKWATLGDLEADFLEAIGEVESGLRMGAVNLSGADGARGGSYGPTQISQRTARALGFTGDMLELTRSAELAAQWTARILNDSRRRGHDLTTLADYVAAWNAGRDDADRNNDGQLEELSPTHSTRRDYLPRAIAALNVIRERAA